MIRTIAAILIVFCFGSMLGQSPTTPADDYLPLSGGTMTGSLVSPRISAGILGSVLQVEMFTGSDVSAKVNACLAIANVLGGATCDARLYWGPWTMRQTIEVLSGTTLLLPTVANWCWNFADGVSTGIVQDSGSSIIGQAAASDKTMTISPCSANTRMLALYATQDAPDGTGSFIYATGFNAVNTVGAAFSKGVVYTRYLGPGSRFERVTAENLSGDAWHIFSTCCDTTFLNVAAVTASGSQGGTALVVEGQAGFGLSGRVEGAGVGRPSIDIEPGNYQLDFWDLHAGTNTAPQDTQTALVNIAGNSIVRFHGGAITPAANKPCFDHPAAVALNDGWCQTNSLPEANSFCPNDSVVYGSDASYLYVCAEGNTVKRIALE
jgi:hypothetical protein